MLRSFPRLALLLSLLLALPLLAADKDKGNDEARVRAKLLEADYLQGKLTQADAEGSDKSFTLLITAKTKVHNQANEAKAIDLDKKLKETKRAFLAKRPSTAEAADFRKREAELKDLQSKLDVLQDVAYEFALKAGKDLSVRRSALPPKVGDDGKPRPYSLQELRKAKGDNPDLPGWSAEVKDLKKDAILRVWLDRKSVELPSAAKDGGPPTYTALTILIMPSEEAKEKK